MAGLDPAIYRGTAAARMAGSCPIGTNLTDLADGLPQCVITGLGAPGLDPGVTHDFAARSTASRGWPAGACPRAGHWPDPWAGHDTGGTVCAAIRLKLAPMGSCPAMTVRPF